MFSSLSLIHKNRRQFSPVAEVSAGRRAELQMAAVLDSRLKNTGFEYVAGLRIPHQKRRREIDVVITTPKEIWLVELKNWSGFVNLDGHNVVQHRSGGRGVVDHGRLLGDLRAKERALRTYLRRSLDEVPPTWTVLVFCIDSVGLHEDLVATDDMDVVRLREFLSALPTPPPAPGPIWGSLRRLLGLSKADSDDSGQKKICAATEPIRQARQVLADLGTWDMMLMYGGQIVSGDIIDFSVDELGDRDRFQRLEVDVPRNYLHAYRSDLGIQATAVERSGATERIELDYSDHIRFHCAGQPKPQTFDLRHIEAISFGYTSSARR